MELVQAIDITAEDRKTVLALLQRHLPGTPAWVYGSRVKWTSTPKSDLDLVVFASPEHRRQVGDLREAFDECNLPFRVDLFVWDEVPESFRRQIEAEHVVLADATERCERDGWIETRLGDVMTLKRGYDLPQRDRRHGSVPVVSSSGITDHHSDSMVSGPGVVTGRYGTLGQVFYIPNNFWPLNTALYVRDFKGNDPRFVSYFLRSLDFSNFSDKAAVPGLNRNHLHGEIVRIPVDVTEQRAIAHILGTLDDKIELNRRMNATLEAMARSLFKSWFVDFDPVRAKMDGRDTGLPTNIADLFPDRLINSTIGQIPDGWNVSVLDDAIELLNGGTPRTSVPQFWDGDIPWYTAKDAPTLSDVFVVDTERTITQTGVDNSATTVLPPRTTIITARGTVGRLACVAEPMAMNQTCYGIRGTGDYPDYFIYWLVRKTVEELRSRTHGTIFDTITRQTFNLVDFVRPPMSIPATFESIVTPIMERLLNDLYEIRALSSLRDMLLPKLVSGELRVRDAEKLVGAVT